MQITDVQTLLKQHPNLLGNVYCGAHVPHGWLTIVDTLCTAIERYCDNKKIPLPVVAQIKEKFGGLRYYVDDLPNELYPLVSFVESFSFSICETCGNPGQLRTDSSYLLTLCDSHDAILKAERVKQYNDYIKKQKSKVK
jgi:hypothetical protein